MFSHCRARTGRLMINSAKDVVQLTQTRKLASSTASSHFHFANLRPPSYPHRSLVTMNPSDDPHEPDALFQQKQSLRSKIRKELKHMDPIRRSEEDNTIQSIVLESPWFKASKSLCAYISCAALREVDTSRIVSEILSKPTRDQKKLYVPRVEDRNSNMRMLKISGVDDLIANSMNILEPPLVDCDGNQREDVMDASDPVDLFILPGLAFDRSGRRLGRSGGYYDMFLKKYHDLAKERKWKRPLLVALSYSLQIIDEGAIAVTSNDVPVDAIVCPAGFIPISPAALERGK